MSNLYRTLCKEGTLDRKKVEGKIVVCLRGDNPRVEKGAVARAAGAAGMILINSDVDGAEILADPHLLPATHINYTDGLVLLAYINSTKFVYNSIIYNATKLFQFLHC